jgi:hypothetical protein
MAAREYLLGDVDALGTLRLLDAERTWPPEPRADLPGVDFRVLYGLVQFVLQDENARAARVALHAFWITKLS